MQWLRGIAADISNIFSTSCANQYISTTSASIICTFIESDSYNNLLYIITLSIELLQLCKQRHIPQSDCIERGKSFVLFSSVVSLPIIQSIGLCQQPTRVLSMSIDLVLTGLCGAADQSCRYHLLFLAKLAGICCQYNMLVASSTCELQVQLVIYTPCQLPAKLVGYQYNL